MSERTVTEQRTSTPIVVRMLLRDMDVDAVYSVVRVDRYTNQTWLCRIDDDSWPIPINSGRIQEEVDHPEGRYKVEYCTPGWDYSSPVYSKEQEKKEELTAAKKEQSAADILHERRYQQLLPFLSDESQYLMLIKSTRRKLIQQRVAEIKDTDIACTDQTLKNLIRLFWKRGMNYAALRSDFDKCGGKGKRRNNLGPKVGAKRTVTPGVGINATLDVQRFLRIGADYFLTKSRPTLQEALDYVVSLYYSRQVVDTEGNVIRIDVDEDAKPTKRQLRYFIDENYSLQHVKKRRHGEHNWELNERELLGTVDRDVHGPGDRFHIDATIADVYLVSQYDRRRIVGRPVIYFIVDVFSRLIVGLYVGFEGPSWIGAMMALVNMVTPKVEYCRQYGINITEDDWPAHFAPRQLLADKGELMSVNLGKNITENLGIGIENAPSGRPDMKSIVEPRFGIVPRKWKQFTPGYVESDFNERGSRDYRMDAALDINQFTAMVIRGVLENSFTPISGMVIHPEMVTENLTSSPLHLWKWGIANRSGALRTLSIDEVALNVMPTAKARVTAKGIQFLKEYYTFGYAIEHDWFSKARSKEWPVDVSYDPRSLDIVYLRDKTLPKGYAILRLVNPDSSRVGKSRFETEEVLIAQKRVEAAGENARQENRLLYDLQNKMTQDEGKAQTKEVADPAESKAQKTGAIRQNRAAEKKAQRAHEHFSLNDDFDIIEPSKAPIEPEPVTASSSNTNRLSLLKQTRSGRKG